MNFRYTERPAAFWLPVVCVLCLICACDDGVWPDPDPMIHVEVRDHETMLPEAGVKLVLMDAASNTVVGGPLLTDAAGWVDFESPGTGSYEILAFPGYGRGVFQRAGVLKSQPGDKTPPEPVHRILTWRNPAFNDDEPRFTGTVVDADTGLPIDGAFMGPGSFADMYTGGYTVQSDVSGPQGAFHVADIPVFVDVFSGNLFQALPLMIQCEGYKPITWRYHFSNGENNTDVTGVTIELTKLGASGTGHLKGQVLFADEPVVGLGVTVSWFDYPTDIPMNKAGVGLPGQTAVTDSLGWYEFTGLLPGDYLVHPGYRAFDGYLQPEWQVNPVRVIADSTVTRDALSVLAEIGPGYPGAGLTISERTPILSWHTDAQIDSFAVSVGRCFLGVTTETQMKVPDGCMLSNGIWGWLVEGFGEGERRALFEGDVWFKVDAPEPGETGTGRGLVVEVVQ
jgi:hypothetical protein